MAYNLPMQINLQAPPASNISAIKKSIEAGIGNIKVADIGTASFAKANAQIKNLTKTFDIGEASARSFFETVEGKARSYAAYAVASTAVLKLSGVVAQATREAIKYEKELIGIAQTTGDTVKQTSSQSKALSEISVKYNIALTKVAALTRILAQTGLSFKESARAAELLAKTSLLASFDNLQDTTEGLVAVMQTFNLTATQSGDVLEKINIVAKKFAVESGDIVEAIRRSGGAFKAAGGQIEELIALFTSVRSTTRESAETIATGFRTIFARLERPKTIEYFKQLGIQLEDANGQFIGPLKAIEAISRGLKDLGIRAGSVKFAEIVEEIGGIRQLSRVIPLLEQTAKTTEALRLQEDSAGETARDLAKAQEGLGYRLGVLNKEFNVLISDIVNSSSFKFLADTFIGISKTVLTLTNALKPLLPILSVLAAYKLGTGLTNLLNGKMDFSKLAVPVRAVGQAKGMASGGLVPGSGNRDTVPAMLTPGEFVIRKRAVNAIGANRLASINKYAAGGLVTIKASAPEIGITDTQIRDEKKISPAAIGGMRGLIWENDFAQKYDVTLNRSGFPDVTDVDKAKKFSENAIGLELKYQLTPRTRRDYLQGLKDSGKSSEEIPMVTRFANGGSVGTDTVPAMLTPGEFVVNKKSAQVYGYANLKRINKYKNGGMVGSAKGNINTDLERGTGNLIYTIDELEKEINNIVNGLGTAGDKIKQMNLQIAVAAPKQMEREGGRIARGSFDPRGKAPVITTTAGVGTQSTVAHEVGHAVDYSMGSGRKYASEQEGTLQNTLAKLAKGQIEAALRAKGVSEKDIEYRTGLKELFADLFEKSQPEVRAILASTTDVNEGMHQLAKVLDYSVATYSRLYGDIQKNLEEAVDASGRATFNIVGPSAPKSSAAPTAPTASPPPQPPEDPILTAKAHKARQKKLAGNEAIEKQIQEAAKRGDTATVDKLRAQARGNKQSAGQLIQETLKGGTQSSFNQLNSQVTKLATNTTAVNKSFEILPAKLGQFTIWANTAASALKNFAGIKINEDILRQGTARGEAMQGAARVLGSVNRRGIARAAGFIERGGAAIGGKTGQYATQIAAALRASAPQIAKYALMLSKGLTIVGWVDLFSTFADSILSIDYSKLKDQAIERGDVEAAGINAQKEYNQKYLRGIPIIGGFLASMQELLPASLQQADAFGQLYIDAMKGRAGIVAFNRELQNSRTILQESLQRGNLETSKATASAMILSVDEQRRAGMKARESAMIRGEENNPTVGRGFSSLVLGKEYGRSEQQNKAITESYKTSTAIFNNLAKTVPEQINLIGDAMTNAATNVIRSGGTVQAAIDTIKKDFDEATFNEIFGSGINTFEDLSKAYNKQVNEVRKAEEEVIRATQARDVAQAAADQAWFSEGERQALEQAESTLAEAEANKAAATARKEQINETQIMISREEALRNEREMQNAAIRQSIELNRGMTKGFDRMRDAMRKFSDIEDRISKIGTGELTRENAFKQSALGKSGISYDTLQMSTEEILRNPQAMAEMGAGAGMFGQAGGQGKKFEEMMARTQRNLGFMDRAEQMLGSNDTISQLRQRAQKEAGNVENKTTEGQVIAEEISTQLTGMSINELEPELQKAFLDYGNAIAQGIDPTEAADKIKKDLGESSARMIDGLKEGYDEVIKQEQTITKNRIELIQRQQQLAQNVYDTEKSYFEERLALGNKVRDALDVEKRGRARINQIETKAEKEYIARSKNLEERRRQQFDSIGLGGMGRAGAVNAVTGGIARTDANSPEMMELKGQANALINTIREEISIENDRMDSLIESAKAQQEYTQSLYDAQGSIVRDLVTGTDEEVGNQLRTLNAAAIAAQQGSFAGIPEDMKKDIFGVFDQFADVVIPGLGVTGRDAQREITKNEYMRMFGVDEAKAAEMASKAVQDRVPIDQRMAEQIKVQEQKQLALIQEEERVKMALLDIERKNNEVLQSEIAKLVESLNNFTNNILGLNQQAPNGIANVQNNPEPIQVQTQGQQEITIRLPDIQALVNQAITATVMDTVAQTFTNIAENVRSATNFDDVANSMVAGIQTSVNREVGGNA